VGGNLFATETIMNKKLKTFTAIPNRLLDQLCLHGLSRNEGKILFAVLRKTIGFQKHTNWMSGTLLENMTGIEKKNAKRMLRNLVKKGILIKVGNEHGLNPVAFEGEKIPDKEVKKTDSYYVKEMNKHGIAAFAAKHGDELATRILNLL